MQELLLHRLCQGRISLIGSDHAPHPMNRKLCMTPASGIPALPFWPKGIELLQRLGCPQVVISRMTFGVANAIFHLNLKPQDVNVTYQPSLWDKYGYNPFSCVDGTEVG